MELGAGGTELPEEADSLRGPFDPKNRKKIKEIDRIINFYRIREGNSENGNALAISGQRPK